MNLRRLWPQKVRTRLTLSYTALFFVTGTALLGLSYGLVAANLPTRPPAGLTISSQEQSLLQQCQSTGIPDLGTAPANQKPAHLPNLGPGCKQVYGSYQEGTAAGMQSLRQNTLAKLLGFWLLGLGVTTVASGGLGWIMAGRVLRPVRAITETARRASEQHLGERLALTGAKDELKELADTFDDMLERLDGAFGAQRRFVANASHELRTPLTLMRTAIDVTLAKPSPTVPQLTDMASRVRRSVDKAEEMIEALLTLAVSERGESGYEYADLATLAEDALDDAAQDISRLGLTVEAKLDQAAVAGDPQLLERMVANLVGNAIRHNEPGGWIGVRAGRSAEDAYLEVCNSGPFVAEDEIPGLFEPFRRLKARTGADEGVGLGLSIIRSVASAHGATVNARSQPEGGLAVRVEIPRPAD
jgi:signal transduction histidine kinase